MVRRFCWHAQRQAGGPVLDMVTPHVVAGVTTDKLDRLCHDYILAHGATSAAELQGVSQIDMYFTEPCCLPWYTRRQKACVMVIF